MVKRVKSIIKLINKDYGNVVGTWEYFNEMAEALGCREGSLRCACDKKSVFQHQYRIEHEIVDVADDEEETFRMIPCKYCGALIKRPYLSHNLRVCPECSSLKRIESHSAERQRDRRRRIAEERRQANAFCVKQEHPDLVKASREARRNGMTYGQWQQKQTVAAMEPWRKHKIVDGKVVALDEM